METRGGGIDEWTCEMLGNMCVKTADSGDHSDIVDASRRERNLRPVGIFVSRASHPRRLLPIRRTLGTSQRPRRSGNHRPVHKLVGLDVSRFSLCTSLTTRGPLYSPHP